MHRVCCAVVVRSNELIDIHGVKDLRAGRHFISEPSFAALLLSKDGSSGYGGLHFLDCIRHDLDSALRAVMSRVLPAPSPARGTRPLGKFCW